MKRSDKQDTEPSHTTDNDIQEEGKEEKEEYNPEARTAAPANIYSLFSYSLFINNYSLGKHNGFSFNVVFIM